MRVDLAAFTIHYCPFTNIAYLNVIILYYAVTHRG